MRWHVQAEGDAPPGDHRDLAERLGKLLGQRKFGTYTSHFGGDDVNGPIHEPAPAAEETTDPDEEGPAS